MSNPMEQPCQNLSELLRQSPGAKEYFSTLPAIVKETLNLSHQNICTQDELRRCGENLKSGS